MMSSWKAKAGPCCGSPRYPSSRPNNLLPGVCWRPSEAGRAPEIAQHLPACPPHPAGLRWLWGWRPLCSCLLLSGSQTPASEDHSDLAPMCVNNGVFGWCPESAPPRGAMKLHVQMSNERCLLTQSFFDILLHFVLPLRSVLRCDETISCSSRQKETRDNRVGSLGFKLGRFLWRSEISSDQ